LQTVPIKPTANEFLDGFVKTIVIYFFTDGFQKTVFKNLILDSFKNRLEKNRPEFAFFFFL
jgi:hypothetical protein